MLQKSKAQILFYDAVLTQLRLYSPDQQLYRPCVNAQKKWNTTFDIGCTVGEREWSKSPLIWSQQLLVLTVQVISFFFFFFCGVYKLGQHRADCNGKKYEWASFFLTRQQLKYLVIKKRQHLEKNFRQENVFRLYNNFFWKSHLFLTLICPLNSAPRACCLTISLTRKLPWKNIKKKKKHTAT